MELNATNGLCLPFPSDRCYAASIQLSTEGLRPALTELVGTDSNSMAGRRRCLNSPYLGQPARTRCSGYSRGGRQIRIGNAKAVAPILARLRGRVSRLGEYAHSGS